MIVLDTSALMAVVLDEPEAQRCSAALGAAEGIIISAGTLAEALIVSARRNVQDEMKQMIEGLGMEVVSITGASAVRVANAYMRWGRGYHPAGLNFGDCFAYELAKERGCRLLYVGEDFAKTDVERAV
jgi:ribonuclease VapC